MQCTNCRREVPDTAKVCGHCGHRLKTAAPVAKRPSIAKQTAVRRVIPGWIWGLGIGGVLVAGGVLLVLLIGAVLFATDVIALPGSREVTSAPVASASPQPEAPTPTDAPTATPEPTQAPTTAPTISLLPSQWNGTYTYTTGEIQNISLLIEKTTGTTFTGKMIWQSFGKYKGAILRVKGEYVTDFGDGAELARWKNNPDFNSSDLSGTWLKWTETEIIDGANYTVNGWYYAHIREDGKMVAVYYFNDTEVVADKGSIVLRRVSP